MEKASLFAVEYGFSFSYGYYFSYGYFAWEKLARKFRAAKPVSGGLFYEPAFSFAEMVY